MDEKLFHKNSSFVQFCSQELQQLIDNTKGINTAVLSTIDGFEVASVCQGGAGSISVERLCAMGSSLLALSSSIIRELKLKHCNAVQIDTPLGYIWIAFVAINTTDLVFLIQTSEHVLQGELIYNARKTRKRLEAYNRAQ